jgi:PKD repeat protein
MVFLFIIIMLASGASHTPGPASHLTQPAGAQAAPAATGTDITDVLLLYDASRTTHFDTNFCRVAEFYGLLCERLNLRAAPLTASLLRDANDVPFKLIGIDAATLLASPSLLDTSERQVLQNALAAGSSTLLVSKLTPSLDASLLTDLTDGDITGATTPDDSAADWFVTSMRPTMTSVFSGQYVQSREGGAQSDYAITIADDTWTTTILSSTDSADLPYPIFVEWNNGGGSVLVDAGQPENSLDNKQFWRMYYLGFSGIAPLMFAMRYTMGDEIYHQDQQFANLTIDDPKLVEPYQNMNYAALLTNMQQHNFHTTIAFIPKYWQSSQQGVIDMFRNNPEYLSLVQHGNNHDGYEFYKYTNDPGDPNPARPLAEQYADIIEGMERMDQHRQATGIADDRVMVFPWGIAPARTMRILKGQNFLATVNRDDYPLGSTRPSYWDYGMHPASLDFESFPVVPRRRPGTYYPFVPDEQLIRFDLFLGKPALLYSHEYEVFEDSIDGFNGFADRVNNLEGDLEWHNLGYILRRLYLEKRNDDGSINIKMYTAELIYENQSGSTQTYHISKEETGNVPIVSVTLNGVEVPYTLQNGMLTLDAQLSSGEQMYVQITYAPADEPPAGLSLTSDSPTTIGSATSFNASITAGSDVTYTWDFGDGNAPIVDTDEAAQSYIYGAPGSYTATITATNGLGSATDTTIIVVEDEPISGLSLTSDSPTTIGSATSLTATITAGTSVLYTWDFGDDSPTIALTDTAALSHTYSMVGSYTATVTATNSAGTVVDTTTVQVSDDAAPHRVYLPLVVAPDSQGAASATLPRQAAPARGHFYPYRASPAIDIGLEARVVPI